MSDNKMKNIFEQQQKQLNSQNALGNVAVSDEVLQVIGFIIGNEEFSVPIMSVTEIVKPIEYTRVPGTPPYVLGVVNMRGNVYPLINLRMKFGMQPIKQDKDTRYIFMRQNDDIAGFVIDKLTAAMTLPKSIIDPVPDTLASNQADMIGGIGKQDDNLVTILKVEALLKRDF